ncbi:MAG: hypothetical protein AAF597_17370, partial [Bacteroidota bacterium]
MDPNTLREEGLLEQYLLGLTNREESLAVEEYLARNPEANKEVEHLRRQLGLYLEETGLSEEIGRNRHLPGDAKASRQLKTLQGRVAQLSVVRTGLLILCCLLAVSSVYFYRLSQRYHADHLAERARHVQDDHLHAQEIEHLSAEVVHWDNLQTVVAASQHGNLQLHYLPTDSIVLLDLSHLKGPEAGFAYHVHRKTKEGEHPLFIVDAGKVNALYPLNNPAERLRI